MSTLPSFEDLQNNAGNLATQRANGFLQKLRDSILLTKSYGLKQLELFRFCSRDRVYDASIQVYFESVDLGHFIYMQGRYGEALPPWGKTLSFELFPKASLPEWQTIVIGELLSLGYPLKWTVLSDGAILYVEV
jgi:hypothetical protein